MHSLIWTDARPKANTITKTISNSLKRFLPNNVKTRFSYTGQKIDTKFQINNKTKDQHNHDLVYYNKCLKPTCN